MIVGMAAGVSSPGDYVWREKVSVAVAVGPVMLMMYLVTSCGLKIVFGGDWVSAFMVGACLTPTDPVLANSIVQGSFADAHIPIHVRLLISAESAANDGLALVFLLIPLYLSRYDPQLGFGLFLLKVILYQVVLAVVFGIVFGFIARRLIRFAHEHGLIDDISILSFSIALALLISGCLSLIGADDIFACYVAGVVISWDRWLNAQIEKSRIQEVIDSLLNSSYFILFGTIIPWNAYGTSGLEWHKLIEILVWVITLRRLPITILISRFIPALTNMREAFFFGWFGPIGASAIFYACLSLTSLEVHEQTPDIFAIVCFIVLSSVVIHGGSVSLFHFGITRAWRHMRNSEGGNDDIALQATQSRGNTTNEFAKNSAESGDAVTVHI